MCHFLAVAHAFQSSLAKYRNLNVKLQRGYLIIEDVNCFVQKKRHTLQVKSSSGIKIESDHQISFREGTVKLQILNQ